jgi:hypothetical protein
MRPSKADAHGPSPSSDLIWTRQRSGLQERLVDARHLLREQLEAG